MKHIKEYNNYDFVGQQAALHGMTREEWVAHYASPTMGVDESKFVMTFEKYQKYSDYKNKPDAEGFVEDDLRREIIKLFTYAGISDNLKDMIFTDQSSDKGIKWEIEVKGKGKDLIHAYKIGRYLGDWELYLNKKKASKYDIQQYFLNKYVSDLDRYIAAANGFDSTYQYSDDSRAYKRGQNQAQNLIDLYAKLSNSDKKKAHKAYVDATKNNVDFNDFQGA